MKGMCDSAKEEGVGAVEVLDRVTTKLFVRDYAAMIAAPVQGDVDGVPKGSLNSPSRPY